jgi:tetratricopeptide (TPR) repeat protein
VYQRHSLNKVGDVRLRQGKGGAALDSFKESLDIARSLARADPGNAQAQRDLFISLNKVGDVQLRQGERAAALDSYKESLDIARSLARADPGNAVAQRDLAVSLERVGDVQMQQGERAAALDSYKESLDIFRTLARADTGNAVAQRDLTASLNKVGDVQLRQGERTTALTSYQESLDIARKLAQADPGNAQAQHDLLVSHFKLGEHAQTFADFAAAIRSYEEALAVAQRFHKPDVFKQEMSVLNQRIRFCRAAEQALDDLKTVRQQPEPLRPSLLVAVNKAHVQRKQHDKAIAAAEMLADMAKSADDLYNASCTFALCVLIADSDESKEKDAVRAVTLLRQAVNMGFKDVKQLKTDPDLNALRQRDDFRRLLRELEEKQP